MNPIQAARPLLSVRHLKVGVRIRSWLPWRRRDVPLIEELHLDVRPGEIIGIVGESGCGKSLLARALAGAAPSIGSIRCGGIELGGVANAKVLQRAVRSLVDPFLADVKPRRRVRDLIADVLRERLPPIDRSQLEARTAELLTRVGIAPEAAARRLKSFRGAERARLALARALAARPQVLICDTSFAALEAADRQALFALLIELARDEQLALILFASDAATIAEACSRLSTMVLGKITEQASARVLLSAPRHPYSRALLAGYNATPGTVGKLKDGPEHPPLGCVYHPRCAMAESICIRSTPHLRRVGPDHFAACHFLAETGE